MLPFLFHDSRSSTVRTILLGPENTSINYQKSSLRDFSKVHVSCNKLLYYTIYLRLWSESLNIPCGGFIFSRVKNLYLATLLKSEPFSRCLSMIQISVCSDISQSLIHVPSIHELWRFLSFWICLYSSMGTIIKRCPTDTLVLL